MPSAAACKSLLQRLFHDFAPQHNNDYACVTPAEYLEATPKGMQ